MTNEAQLRDVMRNDFVKYAKHNLYIRTKTGKIELFKLNKAQEYIHAQLEKQKAETGKVRALVLKGRQQGCSTYTAARFYHKVTNSIGTRVFILTHDGEATTNLFNIANRYHENCPPFVKPATGKANTKELSFSDLDGGYKVGTAGNKNVGRSSTIQLFHGSEVAFWENAQDIASGAFQAVPDAPNTEIILESTANGIGGLYYDMCMDALKGDGEYILIFTPWFWQSEYTKEVPKDLVLSEEEKKYKAAHDLVNEQIFWRRNKIQELKSGWLFKQEYPANVMEAFQTSGDDSFINAEIVQKARHGTPVIDKTASLIIGVDPARFGDDRTAIVFREGRVVSKILTYKNKDTMDVRDIVAELIEQYKPIMVNVDVGGLGAGVYDGLKRWNYNDIVREVNFGGKARDDERYKNKRAEMWGEMLDWLKEEPNQIPDDDALQADLTTPSYKFDNNQRLQLESKDDIKKRGMKSPDVGDALALTFAFKLREPLKRVEKMRQRTQEKQAESIFY